jgi:hypothetical protein
VNWRRGRRVGVSAIGLGIVSPIGKMSTDSDHAQNMITVSSQSSTELIERHDPIAAAASALHAWTKWVFVRRSPSTSSDVTTVKGRRGKGVLVIMPCLCNPPNHTKS